MKFDELDARMRVFETAHDLCVLPGIHIVARLDGRGFTRLTKEVHDFAAPFDERFRDHMVATATHLMNCGVEAVYAFTQSDEISLLLSPNATAFGRKERKLLSILAGEASAAFALRLGAPAAFDCRICQLPRAADVRDYFRWRREDAHRNALNAHCYWIQRSEGVAAREATRSLERMTTAEKNEFLFQRGVNFDSLPAWQKRGLGIVWETHAVVGADPRTGAATSAVRRRIRVIGELPLRGEYDAFLLRLLGEGEPAAPPDAADPDPGHGGRGPGIGGYHPTS